MRDLAIVAILVGASAPAPAAPTIDIRAKTAVQLDAVKLKDVGLAEVSGHLTDKHTGDGLGGQTVTIGVAGTTATATTQPDGTFATTVAVPPGLVTIALGFRGTPLLDGSSLETKTDPARTEVRLALAIDATDTGAQVTVTTADKATLPVQIELGATLGALVRLRTVDTGTTFSISRKDAGGPGGKRLKATFAGDATHQAAVVESTFELQGGTTTSMKVSSTRLAFEDELVVSGAVTDDDGAAIPRAAVTLVTGDRRLAQGATDERGRYRFEVEGEIIGVGQYAVQVQTEIGLAYMKPSRSEPTIIRVAAPQPVPVIYTIAAFLATGLAAGGFFLARSKPWQKLRRTKAAAELPANESPIEIVDGGLVANKPSVISTLRRPHDEGFSGVVRDTVRSRPVSDAVITLSLGDSERSVRSDADGSFALEQLTVGDWRAEVAAPGHVTERFTVSIPHRGELRGVRVDLVPVRERIFQLYRHAAEPVLPETRLWGIWSPRQIVDHVRSSQRSPALAALTDFVEEVYFSARVAGETVLPEAKAQVDRAIAERQAAKQPPAT